MYNYNKINFIMMMVFSPKNSNKVVPINFSNSPVLVAERRIAVFRPNSLNQNGKEILVPDKIARSIDELLLQNNDEPRSPSSIRSNSIFRTSSTQYLYERPKFNMFNITPSSDCSSCGGKK